jgi:hypothetical protein
LAFLILLIGKFLKKAFGVVGVYLIIGIFMMIMIFSVSVSARQLTCADNPTQLWHLNEGSGINSEDSCYGYNATLNGDMFWIDGKYRKSVGFNGVNTYLDMGNIYPFNQSMPEFSFSLWVNLSNNLAWQSIFRSGYYNPYSEFMELLQLNDGENDFITFMGASSQGIKIIDDSKWHCIVGTFNGSSQISKIYIDGIFINEYNTTISEITATTTPLYFGFNFDNGFLMTGILDEVAFFNRTLTQQEVTDYYGDYSCSPVWSCSLFNQTCSGVFPSSFECLEVIDSSTCCNLSNLYDSCVYTGNVSDFDFHFVVENLTASVPSYPYVILNSTYSIKLDFPTNAFSDVKMYLTNPDGNLSIFNFSYVDNSYSLNLLFMEEGDYPFVINGTNPCFDLNGQVTGMFKVRIPFNVTFCAYEIKDQIITGRYENDFAYLIAEFTDEKPYYYPTLEQFITPLGFKMTYKTPVFHTLYRDGCGTLTLYEKNVSYGIRLFDGQATFLTTFSSPNISKTYGANILFGKYTFNGTDSYNVYLSSKDIHQYTWLANWIYIIMLILCVVGAVFLFFMFPDKPSISMGLGLGFTIMLTIIRVGVYLFKGW